jgi:hypothetical protein
VGSNPFNKELKPFLGYGVFKISKYIGLPLEPGEDEGGHIRVFCSHTRKILKGY